MWRYDPRTGSAIAVADSFDKPNGLCFSPDERTLYVADNGEPHHLKAFDVLDGGRLDGERVIHVSSPEHPDGLKADSAGRLYATFAGGVEVLSPDGSLLGRDRAARRRQLLLRRPRPQRPLHHGRHGDPRRPPTSERTLRMALVRTRKIIDDAGASAVIAAAEQEANAHGHRVVIAVVDPHGELIELRRTPGAQIASSRVAVDKARTAAIFVRPSREIEEQVTNGRLGALALHGASALTGGIPLKVDGEVVGAIGTSGETPDEDEAISIAGAARRFSRGRGPRAHLRGRAARGRGGRRCGRRARRGAGHLGGRRRRRADVPGAPRHRPGRVGRGDHRQGAHRRDLPPAQQGLRGPGVRRAALRAPPRARGAAPGRRADRILRRGDRRRSA